jgi:phosphoglycolate phosphatase
MYIEKLNLKQSSRVLHLAPERGIYRKLSGLIAPENYVAADFEPSRYAFAKGCRKIDLTAMEEWPSNYFDLIIHVHVLEHIPANIAYPLFHLHRMLSPAGRHLCIIPFMTGTYEENFAPIGDEERVRRFGQSDHLRKFGRDDVEKHLGSILNMPKQFDAVADWGEAKLLEANVPKNHWRGLHTGTVLNLGKKDYKLQVW